MNLYELLRELKLCRRFLTPQQYRTLKGQAVHGDVAGAEKGLHSTPSRSPKTNPSLIFESLNTR